MFYQLFLPGSVAGGFTVGSIKYVYSIIPLSNSNAGFSDPFVLKMLCFLSNTLFSVLVISLPHGRERSYCLFEFATDALLFVAFI